jgi:hypothetical protein
VTALLPIERRIHVSGLVIAAGLIVQLVSLISAHPLAFVAFLLVGTPLVAAGALIYLYSLVTSTTQDASP